VWGVSKGGSPKYKAAEAEYRRLTDGGWKRGPGGQPILARPPRPRHSEFKAPQEPGLSNTRYKHKKKSKEIS
jgi:hypothetical protein